MTRATRIVLMGGGATILLVIQQFVQFPSPTPFTNSLSNWLHVPLFTIITLLIVGITGLQARWRAVVSVLVIAAVSEAAQAFTGRNPSVADLGRDVLGMGIALVALALYRRIPTVSLSVATSLFAAVVTLTEPGMFVAASYLQARDFPVLYLPGSFAARWLTITNRPSKTTTVHDWPEYAGQAVLVLNKGPRNWSGLELQEPPSNWLGFDRVVVDTYNPEDAPQPLTIEIQQPLQGGPARSHTIMLDPGANRASFPLAGLLSDAPTGKAGVTEVVVHTTRGHPGNQVLIGRIALE
jgi:hypothetical protein